MQYGSKKEIVWEDQVGQQLFLCIFFLIYLLMHLFRDFKRSSSHPSFKNPFHLFQQTCMHATEQWQVLYPTSYFCQSLCTLQPSDHFTSCTLLTISKHSKCFKTTFLHLKQSPYHQTLQWLLYSVIIQQHLCICPN